MTLSGYSIEDILLQDTLLDAVETALTDVVEASAYLLPVLVVGAPAPSAPDLQHRGGDPSGHGARRGGQVPSAHLPGVLRAPPVRAGDDMGGTIRLLGADVPFGPDLLFAAEDIPGLVLHAEICEDMFVPVPPSARAALAGATLLANLSGSPITIGRAEDRSLLARSASSRCLAAYVYAAAGGASPAPIWPGTGRR